MANYKKDFSLDSLFNDLISEGISSLESSADISIVEFAEEILFNSKVKLYPTQRAILKAFYGEPLEEDEILILNSWAEDNKCTWLPGRRYRNLVMEAGRRCHSINSYIPTTLGTITFKELLTRIENKESIGIYTYNPNTYEKYITYDLEANSNGFSSTVGITTKSGRYEEVTLEHPYLVWREEWQQPRWLPISEMRVGDRLAVSSSLDIWGTSSIGIDRAKVLGYLLGDGGITTGVRFTNAESEVIADLRECLSIAFPNHVVNQVTNSYSYGISSSTKNKELLNWLREIGIHGKKAIHKYIPDCIKQAPKAEVAAFLNRLFACDGYVSIGKIYPSHSVPKVTIGICLASENFVRDIQLELLKFGINSRITYKLSKIKSLNKSYDAWCLSITDYQSLVNFIQQIGIFNKEDKLIKALEVIHNKHEPNAYITTIPKGVWSYIKERQLELGFTNSQVTGQPSSSNFRLRTQYAPQARKVYSYGKNLNDKWLCNLAESNIYWDEVASIEDKGIQETVALEVLDTHVIGNSIISHNSGKSTLVSIIVLLEFYKLITLNNPAEYYKLLPGSPIAIFVISQSAEQVKETLFASIRGYAEGSDYFKSLEKAGKIEILTDEIRCRHKNIGIYAKHTNSKSLVGYSLKCLILDEVARFEYDEFGNSKADHLWENIGRGCQYKDDLIYTSIGSITHKELLERYGEGIDILTLDPNTYTPYFTSNYSIKSNGIQDIYTLKTRTGLEGNYTDNHPFLVWRQDNNQPQWIELKDIQIGDRLAILTTVPYQGTNNSISKEKARLLGYLIGDGGISQNHIKFTNVSKEIIDDFQSILDKEYPGYKLVNYSKSKSYDYTVKSLGTSQPNLLKQWLRELGLMGKTSYTKFIPPDIISSSNDVLAEFIKGLFATDGYITNSKNIGIGLTNKNLIISLQRELLRFNVFSNVRLKNNKYFSTNTFNGKVSYVLEIRDKENILNFYTNIGLIPSKEQRQLDLLEIVLERKDKSKNGLSLLPLGLTKRFKEYKINNDLSWSDLLGRGYGGIRDNHCMSLSLLKGIDIKDDLIKYLVNSSIRWDEVKSVDYFKQDETIALSIPDTNIIGNPIISHNTITFGAEGHKIAISSAWEPGDYIEKLYEEVAIRDSSTLGLRLRTWDVNLNPNMSEESIKSSEDYIKDPISAATEYEGIRVLKQGTFMVIPNVKESFKGISSVDGRQVPIDTTNELGETRYYVGVKLSRVEPLTIGNSFAHVDYGVKKDSAALAICNPILIDNTWGIIVSTLLVWKPYIDRDKNNKGIQRIVSFLDMEEKLIELCKARRVMTCSFDSYNSQHAIQKLHLEGINTVEMSTSNANQLLYYSTTKTLIDQRLLILPRDSQWSPTLEYELCNLVQLPNGRVDHPKGSEHGKDTADAIANAIYNCYLYMIQSGLTSNIHIPVNAIHSNHLVGTSSSNRKHISRREGINKLKQFKSIQRRGI